MEDTPVRNPRNQASFFSQLTVSWINDVLKLGSKQPLEEKHLFPVETSNQAERLVADLEREWQAEERASEQNRTKPRLWKAMMRVISRRDYVIALFLRMFYFIAFHLFPLIVWFFLKSISTSTEISYKSTLPFVVGISLVAFVRTLCSNHGVFKMDMISTKLKVAMTGLVYKKASNFHQTSGMLKVMYLLWICIATLSNWFKKLATLVTQSEFKLKPIIARSQTFSRALRRLHVFALGFDWFSLLSLSFVIGQSDNLF